MADHVISWEQIRAETDRVSDKGKAVLKLTSWPTEHLQTVADSVAEVLKLSSAEEAIGALLDMYTMRQYVDISEDLSEGLQLALLESMWIHEWSVTELKQALADIYVRLQLPSTSPAEGIQALCEVSIAFRHLVYPGRWPNREARLKLAEIMWLNRWDEETAYTEVVKAIEYFDLGQRAHIRALDAIREIGLIYRRLPVDKLGKTEAGHLAEIMWVRGWTLEKAVAEASRLQGGLDVKSVARAIRILHAMCLFCGGREKPNRVSEPVLEICSERDSSAAAIDRTTTDLTEYMWLGQYTVGQAVMKLGRFARVNNATLPETLDVMLGLERERFRADPTRHY